ncbi:MAG: 3-dehydroquinate synthase [Spirochaetota bacterium]
MNTATDNQALSFLFGDRETVVSFSPPDKSLLPEDAVWIADENTRQYAPADCIVVPPGEASKSWDMVHRLLLSLLDRRTERGGTLVGVGGGVICDLTAFVASIYARGIHLVLVPTSLLAMVDAALGGKTGIDFGGYKNMVGTFYPAERLIVDPRMVETLPDREYKSGLGETIKTGLLGDEELLSLLESRRDEVLSRNPKVVEEIVRRCVTVKGRIASADFREGAGTRGAAAGDPGAPKPGPGRAALNLGHTFAHALEAVTDLSRYTHGEAVAWGIYRATLASRAQGRCSEDYLLRVRRILEAYGFDLEIPDLDADALVAAMYRDKKTAGGALKFVLQEGPGRQELVTLEEPEIRQALGVADYSS